MKREVYNRLTQAKTVYGRLENAQKRLKQKKNELAELTNRIKDAEESIRAYSNGEYKENEDLVQNEYKYKESNIPCFIAVLASLIQLAITLGWPVRHSSLTGGFDPNMIVFYGFHLILFGIPAGIAIYYTFMTFKRDNDLDWRAMIGTAAVTYFILFCFCIALGDKDGCSELLPLAKITIVAHIVNIICIFCVNIPAIPVRKKERLRAAREKDTIIAMELLEASKLEKKDAEANYAENSPILAKEIEQLQKDKTMLENQIFQILGVPADRFDFKAINTLISYHDDYFVEMRGEPEDLDDLVTFANKKQSDVEAKLAFDAWKNRVEAEERAKAEKERIMRDLDATLARNRISNEIEKLNAEIKKLNDK